MGIFRKNKRQFGIRSHRNLFVAIFLGLVFGISGVISLIMNAMAADVPVPSVEILSQNSSYPDGHPGAWRVTKSAEWTDFGKARVTFKVESVAKYGSNKLDVVMVVDNSGSMSGAKMSQVKADAIDLTDTLLSDPNNRMALVAFNSTAEILSGFTNNKTLMINMINGISVDGSTNYNQGLIKTLEVLDGYSEQNNRDLVILFLTDGFPNEETMNEVAQYRTIKTLYPYATVNGIQYEMGEEILEPIIRVSDNQYLANMDSLNNVLFEATIVPYVYDDFVITDYINNDYWTLSDANKDGIIDATDVTQDVSATIGMYENGITYNFPDVGVGEQIQWDISGLYRSGQTATLTIDLDLKEQYLGVVDDSLLFPTNAHETIVSSLEDTADEDIDSPLTPKLRVVYDVIYDANEPNGCTVPDDMIPEDSTHVIYSTVEISDAVLSCYGYTFKGWSITTDGIDMINDDYFRMPGKDVVIKAAWGKPDILKSMGGKMHVRATATFDKGSNVNVKFKKLSGQSAGFDTQNTTITNVKKVNSLSSSVDINNSKYIVSSADSMVPIYAWYDNGTIYYYTDAEEIYLNADASYMFNQFRALSSIEEAGEWNASNATSMRRIFYCAGYDATDFSVDVSGWNTSNVTSMREMFEDTGYSATTWSIGDLSDWDVSSATDMGYMFERAGYSATNFSLNLSGWDASRATNMSSMFREAGYSATNFSLNLSGWDASRVTDMSRMFYKAGYNADIFSLNVTGWNVANATDLSSMFENAGYNATNWSIGDLSGWDVSNVENMSDMFRDAGFKATSWLIGDISSWNVSSVTNMSNMFREAGFMATSWSISDLSGWNTSNVKNTESMFATAFYHLPDFSLDLSGWNMSKVTNMSSMFFYAGYSATTWSVGDLSGWNVSNAVDMDCMFSYSGYSATTWSIGDISGWDVSSVTTMSRMFEYAGYNDSSVIALDLSGWNTSNVTNMASMFRNAGYNATSFSLNLSGWNTSGVTDMSRMLSYIGYNASSVSLNLSGWDTSNVINMSYMFECAYHNVPNFSLDLSGWNTSNVTDMHSMFSSVGYNATSFSLNLSGWNTSNVTDMSYMFSSTGSKASPWEVVIPATNGAGISNTNSRWYGNSTSVSASLKSGREFTLATP